MADGVESFAFAPAAFFAIGACSAEFDDWAGAGTLFDVGVESPSAGTVAIASAGPRATGAEGCEALGPQPQTIEIMAKVTKRIIWFRMYIDWFNSIVGENVITICEL